MFEYLKLRLKNRQAKQAAQRQAALEQDYDGYSPSHDQTFVWPPELTSLGSPPWWAWVLLMIPAGMVIHQFVTFN
jgi:hypothetical protein